MTMENIFQKDTALWCFTTPGTERRFNKLPGSERQKFRNWNIIRLSTATLAAWSDEGMPWKFWAGLFITENSINYPSGASARVLAGKRWCNPGRYWRRFNKGTGCQGLGRASLPPRHKGRNELPGPRREPHAGPQDNSCTVRGAGRKESRKHPHPLLLPPSNLLPMLSMGQTLCRPDGKSLQRCL